MFRFYLILETSLCYQLTLNTHGLSDTSHEGKKIEKKPLNQGKYITHYFLHVNILDQT
jgi:hypothetical protein